MDLYTEDLYIMNHIAILFLICLHITLIEIMKMCNIYYRRWIYQIMIFKGVKKFDIVQNEFWK